MSDTRKDKRAHVSLKVRFKSATVDEFIEQYSKDISHGGLFIKSKTPMAIGTLLKFEFQLKDESKLIQGVGRVVWKREQGDSDGDEKPAGMGIKFIKMDGESKTLVDQIVDGRPGPGQYEAGAPAGALSAGGDADGDAGEAPSGKRPVRSQKATMQFFPSTTPQNELPKPEDRTQVRHASEFLASALASGGVDDLASKEADAKADEARKRTEEIEREREAQAKAERDKEESAARERAERERQDREKAEREEREAEAKKKKELEAAATAKAPEKSVSERPAAKTSDRPAARSSERPAAKKDDAKKVAPVAEPTPAPGGGGNMVMPIAAVLLIGLAIGGYFYMNRGGAAGTTETPPTTTTTTEPGTDPVVEPGTEPGTDPVVEGTEPVVEPPPPAPTFEVTIETTPPGATLLVAGAEVGTSPATVALPEGPQTVTARLPGYAAGTGEVTVAADAEPLRITLTALPYAVEVVTTPPGARLRIGTRTGTSPGRIEINRPTAPVRVIAMLSGYADATGTVAPDAFTETDDAMVGTVTIAMVPRLRPAGGARPPGGGGGAATGGGGAETGGGGGAETGGGGAETGGGGGGAESGGGGGGETGGGGGGETGGGGGETGDVPENPF